MFNNWRASQGGTAIVLTPRDEGKYLQDLLFENNIVYNTGSMIGLSGKDNHVYTPIFSNQIAFRNNLFIISQSTYGGDGRLALFTNAPNGITFDHNTVISDGPALIAAYDSNYMNASGLMDKGGAVENLTFTNNVAPNGAYGFIANGSVNGAGFTYFPGVILTSNVLAGYTGSKYPPGNFYPTLSAFQALFLNYAAGDYRPVRRDAGRHGRQTDGGGLLEAPAAVVQCGAGTGWLAAVAAHDTLARRARSPIRHGHWPSLPRQPRVLGTRSPSERPPFPNIGAADACSRSGRVAVLRTSGAESSVWVQGDDGELNHPGLIERQRVQPLAHVRLGICLHEDARAGDVAALPDLPDEPFGVERTRLRPFLLGARGEVGLGEGFSAAAGHGQELHLLAARNIPT